MRSIAKCVLPVLVGPSTAVTLRMPAARSRLIRKCPHGATWKCRQALQSGVTRSRGGGKKTAATGQLANTGLPRPSFALNASLCLATVAVAILGHALDGHDLFAFLGLEYAHALGVATGDAHIVHRHADELASVGDQHDLVALFHGKRSHQRAVALVHDHGDNAFATTAGDAVVVGGGSFPESAIRYGEHELLARGELGVPLRRELDGFGALFRFRLNLSHSFRELGALRTAHGQGLF